ncbi:MAG: DUF5723 family protein [bacterium]|nr:DUF5723 family protein [bacterium]
MRSSLLTLVLIFSGFFSFSQTQGISYTAVGRGVATSFVTDYHSLGINSSALGWGNEYGKRTTMGTTEFNLGFYSDSLDADKLKSLYQAIRNEIRDKDEEPADWQTQQQNARDYLESGIAIDASYNWMGMSYYNEKLGGIAFNIGEHYNWYSRLSEETSDIIFEGKLSDYFDQLTIVIGGDTSVIANDPNLSEDTLAAVIEGTISVPLELSEITRGSRIKFTWNRHYNIGYGRKLFGDDSTFAIYGGIGGRFIQSMAMMDLQSDENGIRAYSSISPSYDIDYGSIAALNPSNFTASGAIPKPVGTGYGVDLSASARIGGFITLSAAVNNIGSVTYTRNVYSVNDTLVGSLSLAGLNDANITNSVEQLLQDGGILSLEGEEKYKVTNAANFRLGGDINLWKKVRVGIDVVAPFDRDNPGSLANAVYSVGGEFRPMKWLSLSAGYFGGGIYAHNIPVGINFILGGGTYEFGISSRDALTFFTEGSNSISTAFGFARVRF